MELLTQAACCSTYPSHVGLMEFGWWQKDAEGKKHQVCVDVFGKTITWTQKYGHNSSWEPYGPLTDADWDKLIDEAKRRVPRRLFTQKQFEFILSQRPQP